jgi:hypothetical protein
VKDQYITLYPNPAQNELHIESSLAISEVHIFDNIGRLVLKTKINLGTIDISKLQKGIYHLQCSGEGASYNVKFVKVE